MNTGEKEHKDTASVELLCPFVLFCSACRGCCFFFFLFSSFFLSLSLSLSLFLFIQEEREVVCVCTREIFFFSFYSALDRITTAAGDADALYCMLVGPQVQGLNCA